MLYTNLFQWVGAYVVQRLGLRMPDLPPTPRLFELETGYPLTPGTDSYQSLLYNFHQSIKYLLQYRPRISLVILTRSNQVSDTSKPLMGYLYDFPDPPPGVVPFSDYQIYRVAPFPTVASALAKFGSAIVNLGAIGWVWSFIEPFTTALVGIDTIEKAYGRVFSWKVYKDIDFNTGDVKTKLLITINSRQEFVNMAFPGTMDFSKIGVFWSVFPENIPDPANPGNPLDVTSDYLQEIFRFSPMEAEFIRHKTTAEFLQYVLSIRASFVIDPMASKDFRLSPNSEYISKIIDEEKERAKSIMEELRPSASMHILT